jgi:hypothetical protein
MALAWSAPKAPPPWDGALRAALGAGSTGTDAATAALTDGLDCRGLTAFVAHVETAGKASGTIRIKGMLPGDTVTVGGTVFTATKQDSQPGAAQFKVGCDYGPDTGDDYITAQNLAAVITANGVGATVQAYCAADEALVTVTALADGAAGNAIALATSSARAVVSGATLAGGSAAVAFGPGASVQYSVLDAVTGRWNRAPDLDQPLTQGLTSQALPPVRLPAGAQRVQGAPNAVGAAVNVILLGIAGRIP